MKILFIVVGHFSPSSGVGRTAFSLARELSRENELTVMASGRRAGAAGRFRRVPFRQTGKNWSYYLPFPLIWNFFLAGWLCFINRNRYDIIHVFNGLVWSKKALITLQMCQRGAITFSARRSGWERLKKKSPKHLVILILEWLIYRWELFRKLVVCSEFEKREIINFYRTDPGKIAVLYNGIDEIKVPDSSARRVARTALGYSGDDNVCLFVGYDLKRKGLEFAIRAISFLPPQYRLLIVGGEDSSGDYIKMLTKERLLNRVRFAGPQRDLSQSYRAADILVFPTLYEPFGTVVVEAMGHGLPVVVSRTAGAAELITDSEEGFLIDNPRDPREIAGLTDRIITHDLGPAMGRAGRETARTCTWEKKAREMLSLYESLS